MRVKEKDSSRDNNSQDSLSFCPICSSCCCFLVIVIQFAWLLDVFCDMTPVFRLFCFAHSTGDCSWRLFMLSIICCWLQTHHHFVYMFQSFHNMSFVLVRLSSSLMNFIHDFWMTWRSHEWICFLIIIVITIINLTSHHDHQVHHQHSLCASLSRLPTDSYIHSLVF